MNIPWQSLAWAIQACRRGERAALVLLEAYDAVTRIEPGTTAHDWPTFIAAFKARQQKPAAMPMPVTPAPPPEPKNPDAHEREPGEDDDT